MSDVVALDGSDDGKLYCFKHNPAGLRQLQSKRLQQVANMVEQSSSSVAVSDDNDLELDMSVDDIEEEEDEDIEPLVDSDDSDDENDSVD